VKPAESGSFRHSEFAGQVHIETPESIVFHESKSNGRGGVLDRKSPNLEAFVPHRFPRRKFSNRNGELQPISPQLDRVPQTALAANSSPHDQVRLPALKAHGPQETGQAQVVIGVQMTDEDLSHTETDAETHHLALRALTAIEEKQLPFPLDGDG
jgi:hypothetical protein